MPLSKSPSASQVSSLPVTLIFVGADGGVLSDMAVSLLYSIHAFAIRSFGSHTVLSGGPVNLSDATGAVTSPSPAYKGAIHPSFVTIGRNGSPFFSGNRADRHASNHGIARYR